MPLATRTAAFALALVFCGLAAAPSAVAQGFGRNKIQYDGFDWHVLRTEHFDVYYYPEAEDLAAIGAETAEEVYDELETRFDFSLTERVPLVFYATNLHFKQTNTIGGFIPDGVGGFFEFLKGRVVIPADGNLHRFRRVIRHELVHVFTFNKLARVLRDHRQRVDRVLPLWFTEGLAEYWSGEPDFQHEMILRDAVASNFFVPLSDFDRIAGTYVMYKEGEAFCRFVAETYGEERILELVENAWRSPDFSDVIEHVLGQEERAVSDRWDAWTRAQYLPKVVGADVPSLVAEPVAAHGFSAKPAVWTRPDGRQEVIYMSNRGSYSTVAAQPVDEAFEPTGEPRTIVRGERSEDFEAFHMFESRLDVSESGTLALVSKRGAADVVHLIDLATERREAMLGFEHLIAIYSPTLSADARRVAFTGIDRGGMSDLYLYDRDAETLDRLTNDEYDDRDPDFSPDGTRLVFSSDRTTVNTVAAGTAQAYNLFTYTLSTHEIAYVTSGEHVDLSPRWSPDGTRILFASSRREADGKFSAQDVWLADLAPDDEVLAEAPASGPSAAEPDAPPAEGARLSQLTRFTSAAYDPTWAGPDRLVFTAFEHFRFTVRTLPLDSLAAAPEQRLAAEPAALAGPWAYERLETDESSRGKPYRKRYQLDVAQGGVTTARAIDYNAGGATLVFSDMLGDDRIFVSAYSASGGGIGANSFLDGLNASVVRMHLGRRANVGYGVFRSSGPRYDRTDLETTTRIPTFEQVHGALGVVSYPLSFFQRVELQTSFGVGRKVGLFGNGGAIRDDTLRTGLLANSLSLVHDNALYSRWGPVEGTRANVSAGYVADVLYSNENYYALSADLRHYQPLGAGVTLASWGMVRANVGRRARLNLLGGPWSLRGFDFFRVRGQKLWFTSQELRFPVWNRPPLYPLFAGFRGALFVDAAHNWNDGYNEVITDPIYETLQIGTTKGSLGAGVRTSLLGAIVLRYDLGWAFDDGFDWDERRPFGQFFFGYDF